MKLRETSIFIALFTTIILPIGKFNFVIKHNCKYIMFEVFSRGYTIIWGGYAY